MTAEVAGYVLAGGKSSRMGRDKALLALGGRTLVERAVETLRRVCEPVHILSGRQELAAYGPLVGDVHPGCGPLGGMEAALLHTATAWNLFLPVDMPFVSAALLAGWVGEIMGKTEARVALFTADGVPQPALCLLHRGVLPFVREAIGEGEFKVLPVLRKAASELATRLGADVSSGLLETGAEAGWFANVNTPEEFAAAEGRLRKVSRIEVGG